MRHIGLAPDPQTQRRGVEKTALRIQPRGAHRVVVSVHQVTDNQRLAGGGFHLPSGFVGLLNAQVLALLRGPHLQDLLGKFTHQVTAWNPHRQLQHLQF